MKKILFAAILTLSMALISGCGSNDFDVPGQDNNGSVDQNGSNGGGNDDNGTGGDNSLGISFMNATSIVVSSGGQKKTVSVQLVDKDSVGISGKTVKVKTLPAIYGSLSPSSSKTDESGKATFSYTAPKDISKLNNTSHLIEFFYQASSSSKIAATAMIKFSNSVIDTDQNITLPIVVIPEKKRNITLNSNSQSEDIEIHVYKDGAPYSGGKVKVVLPNKVLSGKDVGSFNSYEIAPVNGKATFYYTGPSNLISLINSGDTESVFGFYHTENMEAKQEMHVKYERPQNSHVSRNYYLDMSTDGDFSMGIPDQEKTFTVLLKAQDGSGQNEDLTTEQITKLTVETTNGTVAQILDGQSLVNKKDLTLSSNGGSFVLKSKKLSGLVPIKVTLEFTDVNGKTHGEGGDFPPLTTIINVRVFSGPPTAISISYVGTTQDAQRAKYIETFAITVTDEYGNKVNTHPNISVGAIAGYAVAGTEASGAETNETRRLFYGRSDILNGSANGHIIPGANHSATFTADPANVFKYTNAEGNNTDKLVVFGAGKNYEAMGKWDFAKSSDSTLDLEDQYFGSDRSGLYYAVGHNYYQDQCLDDGREWIGFTDASSYIVDDEGTVRVKYIYDYHLTGKDVTVWVNLDGLQPDSGKKIRLGEATKHTLRGTGFTKVPSNGYKLEKGQSGYGTFVIWHENAPERYRNGHFGYVIKSGSTCAYQVVATSNWFDARTCSNSVNVGDIDGDGRDDYIGTNDGTSYVTFFLTAPDDKACTFDIDGVMVSSEF